MPYSFDSHGWLSLVEIPNRTTEVEPPAHGIAPVVGQPWPNYIGGEIGWTLIAYVAPTPAPSPTPNYGTRVTRLAFRNRFTAAEKTSLYTAANTSVQVRIYLDDLAAATYVDLARADTIASIEALVAAGILTADRAAAILTAPVQPEEVPQ